MSSVATLAALVGTLAPPAPAQAEPVRFGVHLYREPFNVVEFERLRHGGGGVVRTSFLWFEVQPTPRPRFHWMRFDALVARAAHARVDVLPILIGSPGYASDHPAHPPTTRLGKARYARYVREAVARYGHRGSFWRENPGIPYRPVKAWEVWNEPNLPQFWTDGSPRVGEYAALLRLTSRAIRRADPRAEVVLGGMPEVKKSRRDAIPGSRYLDRLYRIDGTRRLFDVVGSHPYAPGVPGVARKVDRLRRVMLRHGDAHEPLWITEVGWSSAGRRHPLVKDPETQAGLLRRTFALLRARRQRYGLDTVVWFRWQDPEERCLKNADGCWHDHAGLFTGDEWPKPAWSAFASEAGGQPLAGPLPSDAFEPFLR